MLCLNWRSAMKHVFLIATLLCIGISAAGAELMSESDIPLRYTRWHIAYDVNSDARMSRPRKGQPLFSKKTHWKMPSSQRSHLVRALQRV